MDIMTKYEIEPVRDIVLVKRRVQSDQLESGLYVAPSAVGVQQLADVIAVGPGSVSSTGDRIKMQVTVGDVVILDTIAGYTVELDGKSFTVVREAEIVAILRNKE